MFVMLLVMMLEGRAEDQYVFRRFASMEACNAAIEGEEKKIEIRPPPGKKLVYAKLRCVENGPQQNSI